MDTDNKGSDEDSTSSSHKKEEEPAVIPSLAKITRARQQSLWALEQMAPQEQEEVAQDMYAQMKQLKEHNEAMGYHGYSGYLQRHDSGMNLPETEVETETDADIPFNIPTKYDLQKLRSKHGKHHKSNNSVILSETAPLKQKLDNISSSINNIRHDLNQQNSTDITAKELKQTIAYFQNQLTDIQDQIEDAENDIESNIDVKFIKYQEDIKLNKQKIKSMKKRKKEKEKQEQIQKQKEQEKIIEVQRLQIQQLTQQASTGHSHDGSRQQSPETGIMHHAQIEHIAPRHQQSQSVYFPLNNAPNNTNLRSTKSLATGKQSPPFKERRSITKSYGILPRIQSEDSYEATEDDEEEMRIQYLNNQQNAGYLMAPQTGMQSPGMTGMGAPGVVQMGMYNEGQFQLQRQPTPSDLQQRPILSDAAIKIIGGVVIVLAGLWIISKYFDSKKNRGRGLPRYKHR